MRGVLLAVALLGFGGLGVLDLARADYRHGTAALLLTGANWLLLTAGTGA